MNSDYSKEELDNHANQLNPNNDAYWSSRGLEKSDDDDGNYGLADDFD